jgi:hypothetical protein
MNPGASKKYIATIKQMEHTAHNFLTGRDKPKLKLFNLADRIAKQQGLTPPIALAAALDMDTIQLWTDDPLTTMFLSVIDTGCGHEATFMQAESLIETLENKGLVTVERVP